MSFDIGSVVSRAIEAVREQAALLASEAKAAPAGDCGCTPESNPGYPTRPPTDPGAGEHGSQPIYARGDDVLFEQLAYKAADAAELMGLTHAAKHLRHYLGNSGEDLTVDPGQIIRDVPQFGQAVDQQLDAAVNAAIEQAVAEGCYGEPIAFDSGWQGFYLEKSMSSDWFYAMGGVQHSVTGTVVVHPGDPPTAEVSYQVHVFDRYNWDGGKSTDIGPFTITDEQMGELHTAGLAQEYDIVGSTGETGYTATYNPGGDTGNPGVPEAGDRDGGRTDPGR